MPALKRIRPAVVILALKALRKMTDRGNNMRQILFGIAAFLCIAVNACASESAPPAPAQAEFKEGVHYIRLADAQPDGGDKIEVIEFFWYGCPHCAAFDPYIQTWKQSKPAGVKFTPVPAIFRPDWVVGAKAFYALELLDALEVHSKVFDKIHKEHKAHQTPEHYAEIVAELGVDKQKFLDATKSFVVDSKVRRAAQMIRDYRIMAVPTLAVNGKYTTSGSLAGSNQEVLSVVDYLIGLEKKKS
jgi:thiol:disulfide interchange protein DsbA